MIGIPVRGALGRFAGFAAGCVLALSLTSCSGSDDDDDDSPPGTIHSLEIKSRTDAFGGTAFGTAGTYEYIAAVATGRLDPGHASNAGIVDLALAPRTADGMVEYKVDVGILRPKNAATARRVLFYDVVNRGSRIAHTLYFNEGSDFTTGAGAGTGFLMRQGYTVVWSGWQGDVAMSNDGTRMGASFPVAKNADGTSITGMSRDEFVFDNTTNPVTATLSYSAADTDPARATLRVKQRQADAWQTVSTWQYSGDRAIVITRPSNMDAGAIYEFIHPAKDPVVMGIGFAAIRDVVSFLRNGTADTLGAPNPLADLKTAPCEVRNCAANPTTTVDIAVIEGISQSGRAVRDFIWQGFNTDIGSRKVFDAAMPLIAGGRKTWTNFRFAQPGRFSRQHEDHFQAGDQFPFTYATTTDPISGATDGIFRRCGANGSCPKLFHIDGGNEFWQSRSSLVTMDGNGNPVALPADVRAYYMTGTPHAYNGTGVSTRPANCAYNSNIVWPASTTRALTIALVDWAARGTAPPATRWITAANSATPLDRQAAGMPDLTPIGITYPTVYNSLDLTDYSAVPPTVTAGKSYALQVPRTDADGNDLAGVRTPDIEVPLGTHLPWNLRAAGFAPGDLCGTQGSYVPFASTDAARTAANDPRPSLQARYTSKADYVARVRAAANDLRDQRLMLQEDVDRWVQRANATTALNQVFQRR